MNEQEKHAVRKFVDSVRALINSVEIQQATSAFIKDRETTEDMLRIAHAECISFADQRLQAKKENVLFLNRRPHLTEACRLLTQAIETCGKNRLIFPFGINVEQDQLHFD